MSPTASPGTVTVSPDVSPAPSPLPPPADTAFAAPSLGSDAGHLELSTTLAADGQPLAAMPVTVTITALDTTYQLITVKGVVPLVSKHVIIGFRFNQEEAGPATINLKIYRITYADGGSRKNRLPNSGFDSGMGYLWAVYGTGSVTTPLSDRGDGRMLRLRATTSEDIAINSFGIDVTPGSTFFMTVTAELPPAGTPTGYAAAMFGPEGYRQKLDLVAAPIPPASLETDVDGSLAVDEALPLGRYLVRLSFAGDATHLPTTLEQEVTVR